MGTSNQWHNSIQEDVLAFVWQSNKDLRKKQSWLEQGNKPCCGKMNFRGWIYSTLEDLCEILSQSNTMPSNCSLQSDKEPPKFDKFFKMDVF